MKRRRRAPPQFPSVQEQVLKASEAMVRYALASGLRVPEKAVQAVSRARLSSDDPAATDVLDPALLRAHGELVRIVAPATPRTILLISEGRRTRLSMLGPVRLVQHMLIAVLILLALFILLSMTTYVKRGGGDYENSSGLPLLANELFFLAAGGLGAAFSALFTAYRYISEGTYDPKYESSYWLRFILGLMAGLLLALLVPVSSGEGSTPLGRPVLALLGGFSAAVLYRILERLVAGVESIVQADSRQLRVAERDASVARATTDAARDRLALVAELRRVQDRARAGSPSGEVADALDGVLESLLPAPAGDVDDGRTPQAPDGAARVNATAVLPDPAGERPGA
jgi:hypothetical protein